MRTSGLATAALGASSEAAAAPPSSLSTITTSPSSMSPGEGTVSSGPPTAGVGGGVGGKFALDAVDRFLLLEDMTVAEDDRCCESDAICSRRPAFSLVLIISMSQSVCDASICVLLCCHLMTYSLRPDEIYLWRRRVIVMHRFAKALLASGTRSLRQILPLVVHDM